MHIEPGVAGHQSHIYCHILVNELAVLSILHMLSNVAVNHSSVVHEILNSCENLKVH